MKTHFTLLLCVALGFSLNSCIDFKTKTKEEILEDSDFKEVEVEHRYRLSLPNYMRETTGLNSEASLQYQNIFKETYTIVIDESKEEFVQVFKELNQYDEDISLIKNYRDVQLQLFSERMNVENQSDPVQLKIDGMDAEMVDIDGTVEGVSEKISYFLTFVEGRENVYMIMSWTMTSRKETYKATFEKLAKSLKLVQ